MLLLGYILILLFFFPRPLFQVAGAGFLAFGGEVADVRPRESRESVRFRARLRLTVKACVATVEGVGDVVGRLAGVLDEETGAAPLLDERRQMRLDDVEFELDVDVWIRRSRLAGGLVAGSAELDHLGVGQKATRSREMVEGRERSPRWLHSRNESVDVVPGRVVGSSPKRGPHLVDLNQQPLDVVPDERAAVIGLPPYLRMKQG